MSGSFQLSIDKEGIALLLFDLPDSKVNKLSVRVLEEMEKILDEASKNKEIRAMLIMSGKEDSFIAGADLATFEPIFKQPTLAEPMIDAGHRVFRKLNALSISHGGFDSWSLPWRGT